MIASAITISAASVGGIVVPRLFIAEYFPKYVIGHAFTICLLAISVILSIVLEIYFKMENKRRDENPVDVSHMSEDEQRLLYDRHPGFRYKY
ncbi:putative transporter [Smittium culicis]|uniref:Putative transporter n=1 Tax=Smittium culicis TaxID=133412 RepID=A0A1R1XA41_9FUNG|nr:putative transporter [Smittium culicis]OMJ12970.1 putative transporter [Smittium culicis]